MEQAKIKKTPMQELIEVVYNTKSVLEKDEKYKEFEFKLPVETVVSLLDNAFVIEESFISSVFDYAYLQAELKERAEVTSGHEYVKKFLKKNENISSKV